MHGSMIAGSCITAREASAAMALITAATEPEHEIIAFSAPAGGGYGGMHGGGESGITRVSLSPRMRLTEVIKRIEAIPMGGTDCALPMLWAARNKLNVSGFITYTDSETWAGNIHPAQALLQYRSEFVGDAKAVVVGMTSNGFTLADPNDRGMLDVVGFDTSTPAVTGECESARPLLEKCSPVWNAVGTLVVHPKMNQRVFADLVPKYLQSYDAVGKDKVWQQHSTAFRRFWNEQILTGSGGTIPEETCDEIIRILDRNGKGNTKHSEAVARAMVPQNVWRKLFNSLRADQKLAQLVDAILKETVVDKRAELIDELYTANAGRKNWLTGESGNVLNALLAAYDPVKNLSVISLNTRKAQMEALEVKFPFDWDSASFGQRIAHSNVLLREGIRALGIDGSARTLSYFWYFQPVKELWKPEDTIQRPDKEVAVTVPQDVPAEPSEKADESELRESLQIQAALAEIGSEMGFQIWLPLADRARVLTKWKREAGVLLEHLPIGFDQVTMKTIEQIDVLWLKRRSIVRAFEVEHTTSVYSGLLRMADLLAMQPNLKIRLHIVAPSSRREKVFQEIRRPVFALLEGGALAETCTYLSYDTVADLRGQQHLEHLSDKVLEDYEEKAQDTD
jgi:hypothetical protein